MILVYGYHPSYQPTLDYSMQNLAAFILEPAALQEAGGRGCVGARVGELVGERGRVFGGRVGLYFLSNSFMDQFF